MSGKSGLYLGAYNGNSIHGEVGAVRSRVVCIGGRDHVG